MNDKNILMLRASAVAVLSVLLCLNACTTAHLNTIPSPAPSAKLRVLVLPITGDPPYPHTKRVGNWGTPHEEYKKKTFAAMSRFLQDKGIYEVVPEKDVKAVLGSQEIEGWQWLKNNMALVRQVGKALHADYAMIAMRNFVESLNYQFEIRCINLESGIQYTSSGFSGGSIAESRGMQWERTTEVTKKSYRQIFYDAKGDMLATAIRKGRLLPAEDIKNLLQRKQNFRQLNQHYLKKPLSHHSWVKIKGLLLSRNLLKSLFLLYPGHPRRQKHPHPNRLSSPL